METIMSYMYIQFMVAGFFDYDGRIWLLQM